MSQPTTIDRVPNEPALDALAAAATFFTSLQMRLARLAAVYREARVARKSQEASNWKTG
ncbi:hypothetical protein [Bradyrhizobium sp. LMTR 3]|uniref:hypothetical protein n=1 Tax=Bradyrhizobium sp. LMTR 3 TaxID=189873 RepID=UPI00159F2EFD|nr:hypothetical protein [Bradyrhizobium sp. LMTR 3]